MFILKFHSVLSISIVFPVSHNKQVKANVKVGCKFALKSAYMKNRENYP